MKTNKATAKSNNDNKEWYEDGKLHFTVDRNRADDVSPKVIEYNGKTSKNKTNGQQ